MMAGGTNLKGPTDGTDHPSAAPAGPADRELLERFTRQHDEAAFAALVVRYGPMVLSVCRRVLGHVQEAEDAFQATFLVLVRKADAITRPDLLGNWLYGVAVRTARKARIRVARRLHHERQAAVASRDSPQHDAGLHDLLSQLDDELERLPDKYRAPLVLCYLDGLTNEEAAGRLGWPTGSISYRLTRGREMLRQRLGSPLCSPAAFALLLRDELDAPELLPALGAHTIHLAMLLVQGGALEAATSPTVSGLVEDVLASMTTRRAGALPLLVIVVLALLALGVYVTAGYSGAGETSPRETRTPTTTTGCH
jgi:RNA polymerase sigma factor (sigma-70 family)